MINSNSLKHNSHQNIQILVVEDEKIIALNLKESLESLGYSVVAIVASGEAAVTTATEYRPDLVLMDIRLKGKMDGIYAAQIIWENLSIPVIYVTGHSDYSTLKRAKITAPFGYILKPVKERELSVTIEMALQRYEREQLVSAILRGMGDGVIVVDQKRCVKFLNQVAESLIGWSLSEAIDRELFELLQMIDEQTQQPIDDPITAALQQDTTIYLEDRILLISKQDKTIPIAGSAAPIKDNKGTITGVVLVFRDNSDRQRVELAIRQQLEKEKKLNQFQTQIIHTVSHEYRTPLSIILTSSQLLESNIEFPNAEKLMRNCQRIQNSVKYMVGLLENIMFFNQAESDQMVCKPAPLDLERFCNRLIEEYQLIANDLLPVSVLAHPRKIQFLSFGQSHVVYLDEKLLQQILGNLLSNALKYSPLENPIILTLTYAENKVIFQVQDQGIGIPSEDQLHIFNAFHRATNVGTIRGIGMGLSIAKQAVNLHQGTISLETEVGRGTTFTVTLPTDRAF